MLNDVKQLFLIIYKKKREPFSTAVFFGLNDIVE